MPPAPGATAFKRGRPVTLLHQTGQGKNTVAQIHAGGATPPRRSPSVGETATPVTERSWECLRLTPGRSLLLRLFVSSILRLFRRRMVLALVQDWASSAAVPLMGGPRVGATSNPRPGIRAEGAPDSSIRWAPVHSLELITLRSSRPFADWTAVRCVVALSCTLSCLVVVTRE